MRSILLFGVFGLACVVGAGSAIVSCGGGSGGDPDGGDRPDATDDAPVFTMDGAQCSEGTACGDGGVCTGNGSCCAPSRVCGAECCGTGTVCGFNKCVTPGATCRDNSDCKVDEYCDYSLGQSKPKPDAGGDGGACQGGAVIEGKCMPRPPICPPVDGGGPPDGAGVSCLEDCRWAPQGGFNPVVKYSWGGQLTTPTATDVMMTPIVTQLDDDDCDGKITANDIPDIVFTTFSTGLYNSPGTLHAITVKNGALVQKWQVASVVRAAGELASGNIDGVPGNEIVGCTASGVIAYRGDGSQLWSTPSIACRMPSIADLDADGAPEVIVEGTILDGKTGAVKKTVTSLGGLVVVADLDQDGKLDLVYARGALRADGTTLADTGLAGSHAAVGDLDADGKPEVVAINASTHIITVWRWDAQAMNGARIVRTGVDLNGTLNPSLCPIGSAGNTTGGGPPTIGDFNKDGFPDVALAGGVGYAVFDGKKLTDTLNYTNVQTLLWSKQTQDCSSAQTGSSLFDFDGDGKPEVVYGDETTLHVYDGLTGNQIFSTCNTNGTLIEYPVIADIDNDGQADIVVASNAYSSFNCGGTKTAGIRVFSSANNSWVLTRRVWNQHAYSITNVDEDGTIPKNQLPNWLQPGLNNFRQNKQPGLEFAASDAVVSVAPDCSAGYALAITIRNLGAAPLPPGIVADVFKGTRPTGTKLGSVQTSHALGPAQAETILLVTNDPAVPAGATVYADLVVPASVRECRNANNGSKEVSGACKGVN